MNHQPCVLWLTGLSGAGKSTIACELEAQLSSAGINTCVLDGDKLRKGLNADLGFCAADRAVSVQRTAQVAQLMFDAGLFVIVAMISPYLEGRSCARSLMPADLFFEVHVRAPLAVCEHRDPKGLYKKARLGLIPDFTGIDSAYENPVQAEITLNTAESSVDECVQSLMDYLQKRGVLLDV